MSIGIRRPFGSLLIVLGVALGLSACGTSSGTGKPAPTKGTTDVKFILNWLPNVEFAGLWVAQQKGWWKQAGIHMSYQGWSTGVVPETDVPSRGANTFGFQSGAAIIIARSKGVPIKALYTGTQKSVFGLTVLDKSPVRTLGDLRGKRVGYQSHELYVPQTMLSCTGLKPAEWKPVQVGVDPSELTSGQVDAFLTFLMNEPIALQLRGVRTRSFPAAAHCFHFYDDVLFTTDALVKSDPVLVRRVVSVAARGFAWAHQHPSAAAQLTVAKYFPAKGVSARANLTQQTLELRAYGPFASDKVNGGRFDGSMRAGFWRDAIDTLRRYREIQTRPAVSSVYTNRFNPYTK